LFADSQPQAEGRFVRAETRHQLKQDRFSKATFQAAERTFDWSAAHKSTLVVGSAIFLIVAGAAFFTWYHFHQQEQQASLGLSQAVRTMDMAVRPAGTPEQPDYPTFASSKERAVAAHKQLQAIVDNYPHTRAADFARYFLGVTSADLGADAAAIREFQAVAQSRNQDVAALAKLALASVYRSQKNYRQAMDLYNALIAKPTTTVSKAMAQMQLAATYEEAGQPLEAKRIYESIQKEDPTGPAAQMASEKLQDLK
jgi:tetratricopeptide (TPR) repeat protein